MLDGKMSTNKNKKKLVFLTGTRADFGKLKSLILATQNSNKFDVHIFVTGMHLNQKYGLTVNEIIECGFKNVFQYINHDSVQNMDRTLARTIDGFSFFIGQINPDLIILHGDRVETLAGAIVGSLNNILVAHIEGGEVSGTIDELIRHSVTKMSHIHLASNKEAKNRLIQLGELKESIYILGSPDVDLMNSETLPQEALVKKHYQIKFSNYAIAMFHPVTSEYNKVSEHIKNFIDALIRSGDNYLLIYPNNDIGSEEILKEIKRLKGNERFAVFPSLKFEYFLALLKHAQYIVGNSSAGISEAPYFKTPTINIGTRQKNRLSGKSIINCDYHSESVLNGIRKSKEMNLGDLVKSFGNGNSAEILLKILSNDDFWKTDTQKIFQDLT